MTFFDTNVLVYSLVAQSENKFISSREIIRKAENENKIVLSHLSMLELVFVLSKLDAKLDFIIQTFFHFKKFVKYEIDNDILTNALTVCENTKIVKNYNDLVHLKFPEKYCDKLITFDKDFKKFKKYSKIDIEILN